MTTVAIQGEAGSFSHAAALEELRAFAPVLRVLGSYPERQAASA